MVHKLQIRNLPHFRKVRKSKKKVNPQICGFAICGTYCGPPTFACRTVSVSLLWTLLRDKIFVSGVAPVAPRYISGPCHFMGCDGLKPVGYGFIRSWEGWGGEGGYLLICLCNGADSWVYCLVMYAACSSRTAKEGRVGKEWKSNIYVWFRFMYPQKWNCAATLFLKQNYNVLSPISTFMLSVSDLYILPGSVTDTWM